MSIRKVSKLTATEKLQGFEDSYNFRFRRYEPNSPELREAILIHIEQIRSAIIETHSLEKVVPQTQFDENTTPQQKATFYTSALKVSDDLQREIEFLEEKVEGIKILQKTKFRELRERHFILKEFGFFDSEKWRKLKSNGLQNKWLSEILQCDPDSAKDLLSAKKTKFKITEEQKSDIRDMLDSDSL